MILANTKAEIRFLKYNSLLQILYRHFFCLLMVKITFILRKSLKGASTTGLSLDEFPPPLQNQNPFFGDFVFCKCHGKIPSLLRFDNKNCRTEIPLLLKRDPATAGTKCSFGEAYHYRGAIAPHNFY
jgi:hypothetical protein